MTLFFCRYSPIAIGVWSFCHEVEKKFLLQSSPAICDGPALDEIRMVSPSSVTVLSEASSTFDQI
ncbi:hypothetical protein D3C83_80100 [compost metagenome]